jgi:hypothetical protein
MSINSRQFTEPKQQRQQFMNNVALCILSLSSKDMHF